MPACDARYDVLFNDGTGCAAGGGPRYQAEIDMLEERLPDDWGEPGPLLAARLVAWRARYARSITYGPAGQRMALWVDGVPRISRAFRQYLRWHMEEPDPPADYDPEWVTPP